MHKVYSEVEQRIEAAAKQKRADEGKAAAQIAETERTISVADMKMREAYEARDVQTYKTAKAEKEDAEILLDMLKGEKSDSVPSAEAEEIKAAIFQIQHTQEETLKKYLADILAQLEEASNNAFQVFNDGNELLKKYHEEVRHFVGEPYGLAPYNKTGYDVANVIKYFVENAKKILADGEE